MNIYEKLKNREAKLAVTGLGYVGMPIAVAFSESISVIGFDVNAAKVEEYKNGKDPTNEVGDEAIKNTTMEFTSNPEKLSEALFHIIAVPTPVNQDKKPNLYPVESASRIVGKHLQKGAIVCYESTVYPGVTEDICVPILEEESGLKCGVDFKIAYSPERINPGDKVHRLENITKIVSGMDEETLEEVAKVYEMVVKVGVHKAGSIRVAEAAKVVENSQRDINIAFMNELAMAFHRMGIPTNEVIEAMNTKWNALKFYPGLVGGHCIGVDPYYFIYEAEMLGYHSQIILSGREINDGMGAYVADAVVKELILADRKVKNARVFILGMTFKEDCPDIRNSKVADIIERLSEYGVHPIVVDPYADSMETKKEYGVEVKSLSDVKDADCIIAAVAHREFKSITDDQMDKMFSDGEKVLIDVKSMYDRKTYEAKGYRYWAL